MVPTLCKKSKTSSKTQGCFPSIKLKGKLHILHYRVAENKHSYSKGRKGRVGWTYQTKARLKLRRANANFCSSVFDIWNYEVIIPSYRSAAHRLSDQLYSMPGAFLGRCPMILALQHTWGLLCNLGFTFSGPCNELQRSPCRDSKPATHCLASTAFWNLGASLYDHLLKSSTTAKLTPARRQCQALRSV